jgi:hypothetical protein
LKLGLQIRYHLMPRVYQRREMIFKIGLYPFFGVKTIVVMTIASGHLGLGL